MIPTKFNQQFRRIVISWKPIVESRKRYVGGYAYKFIAISYQLTTSCNHTQTRKCREDKIPKSIICEKCAELKGVELI